MALRILQRVVANVSHTKGAQLAGLAGDHDVLGKVGLCQLAVYGWFATESGTGRVRPMVALCKCLIRSTLAWATACLPHGVVVGDAQQLGELAKVGAVAFSPVNDQGAWLAGVVVVGVLLEVDGVHLAGWDASHWAVLGGATWANLTIAWVLCWP